MCWRQDKGWLQGDRAARRGSQRETGEEERGRERRQDEGERQWVAQGVKCKFRRPLSGVGMWSRPRGPEPHHSGPLILYLGGGSLTDLGRGQSTPFMMELAGVNL